MSLCAVSPKLWCGGTTADVGVTADVGSVLQLGSCWYWLVWLIAGEELLAQAAACVQGMAANTYNGCLVEGSTNDALKGQNHCTLYAKLPGIHFHQWHSQARLGACIPWVSRSGAEQPPHLGEGAFKNLPARQPVPEVQSLAVMLFVRLLTATSRSLTLSCGAEPCILCWWILISSLRTWGFLGRVSSSDVCQLRPAGPAVCWNFKNYNKVYQACFVISV